MLSLNPTLWIQMALFLVFAGLMHVVFFKPVTRVLAERKAYVARHHAEAHEDLRRIQVLQEDYEARLKAARVEAQEAIQAAVAAAEAKRAVMMTEAKAEVATQVAGARAAIREEKDAALAALSEDVQALASLVARKVNATPVASGARGGSEA